MSASMILAIVVRQRQKVQLSRGKQKQYKLRSRAMLASLIVAMSCRWTPEANFGTNLETNPIANPGSSPASSSKEPSIAKSPEAQSMSKKQTLDSTSPTDNVGQQVPKKPVATLADQTTYDAYTLKIQELAKDCELVMQIEKGPSTQHRLGIAPPCRFVRRDGKLQHFSYPKKNTQAVILISGDPPTPETQQSYRLKRLGEKARDCGEKVRGIAIQEQAKLSSKVAKILVCPQIGADEHLFADFADFADFVD